MEASASSRRSGGASARSAVASRQHSAFEVENELQQQPQQSAVERRRSFMHERPRTSTSAILRSYSSSSFESPDESSDSDSDWDDDGQISYLNSAGRKVS